jgi:hypothetical protein
MLTKTIALTTTLLISTSVTAKDRLVDCAISQLPSNKIEYQGKCAFSSEKGGTFYLSSPDGKSILYNHIGSVTVFIVDKDTAEVSGLVMDKVGGHNSRWGEATRSKSDKACWDGQDFRVCAW